VSIYVDSIIDDRSCWWRAKQSDHEIDRQQADRDDQKLLRNEIAYLSPSRPECRSAWFGASWAPAFHFNQRATSRAPVVRLVLGRPETLNLLC